VLHSNTSASASVNANANASICLSAPVYQLPIHRDYRQTDSWQMKAEN